MSPDRLIPKVGQPNPEFNQLFSYLQNSLAEVEDIIKQNEAEHEAAKAEAEFIAKQADEAEAMAQRNRRPPPIDVLKASAPDYADALKSLEREIDLKLSLKDDVSASEDYGLSPVYLAGVLGSTQNKTQNSPSFTANTSSRKFVASASKRGLTGYKSVDTIGAEPHVQVMPPWYQKEQESRQNPVKYFHHDVAEIPPPKSPPKSALPPLPVIAFEDDNTGAVPTPSKFRFPPRTPTGTGSGMISPAFASRFPPRKAVVGAPLPKSERQVITPNGITSPALPARFPPRLAPSAQIVSSAVPMEVNPQPTSDPVQSFRFPQRKASRGHNTIPLNEGSETASVPFHSTSASSFRQANEMAVLNSEEEKPVVTDPMHVVREIQRKVMQQKRQSQIQCRQQVAEFLKERLAEEPEKYKGAHKYLEHLKNLEDVAETSEPVQSQTFQTSTTLEEDGSLSASDYADISTGITDASDNETHSFVSIAPTIESEMLQEVETQTQSLEEVAPLRVVQRDPPSIGSFAKQISSTSDDEDFYVSNDHMTNMASHKAQKVLGIGAHRAPITPSPVRPNFKSRLALQMDQMKTRNEILKFDLSKVSLIPVKPPGSPKGNGSIPGSPGAKSQSSSFSFKRFGRASSEYDRSPTSPTFSNYGAGNTVQNAMQPYLESPKTPSTPSRWLSKLLPAPTSLSSEPSTPTSVKSFGNEMRNNWHSPRVSGESEITSSEDEKINRYSPITPTAGDISPTVGIKSSLDGMSNGSIFDSYYTASYVSSDLDSQQIEARKLKLIHDISEAKEEEKQAAQLNKENKKTKGNGFNLLKGITKQEKEEMIEEQDHLAVLRQYEEKKQIESGIESAEAQYEARWKANRRPRHGFTNATGDWTYAENRLELELCLKDTEPELQKIENPVDVQVSKRHSVEIPIPEKAPLRLARLSMQIAAANAKEEPFHINDQPLTATPLPLEPLHPDHGINAPLQPATLEEVDAKKSPAVLAGKETEDHSTEQSFRNELGFNISEEPPSRWSDDSDDEGDDDDGIFGTSLFRPKVAHKRTGSGSSSANNNPMFMSKAVRKFTKSTRKPTPSSSTFGGRRSSRTIMPSIVPDLPSPVVDFSSNRDSVLSEASNFTNVRESINFTALAPPPVPSLPINIPAIPERKRPEHLKKRPEGLIQLETGEVTTPTSSSPTFTVDKLRALRNSIISTAPTETDSITTAPLLQTPTNTSTISKTGLTLIREKKKANHERKKSKEAKELAKEMRKQKWKEVQALQVNMGATMAI